MDLKLEKKVTDEIGKLSKWLNLEHCNHNPYYTNLVTVNFIDNLNGKSIKRLSGRLTSTIISLGHERKGFRTT